MNLNLALKAGGKFVTKNLPTILTAVGTVGVIFGTVLAAKKAPEAQKELQEIKDKWQAQEDAEKRDKVEYTWRLVKCGSRYYGIVAIVIGGSIVCFWVANHLNLKRLAAALAAAKVSSDYAKDLEDQIRKEGGEGKLTKIKDEINAGKIRETPCDIDTTKLNHVIGETPVYDPISENWYPTTAERIRRAVLMVKEDLADQLLSGEKYAFVAFSEFREWAGLVKDGNPSHAQNFSNQFGFAIMLKDTAKPSQIHELVDEAVGVDFTAEIMEGCVGGLALKYRNPPKYQYDYEGRW